MVIFDDHGNIQQVNLAAQNKLGYTAAQLKGQHLSKLLHSPDRDAAEHLFFHKGEDHCSERIRYKTRSGKTLFGDTNISIVRTDNGELESGVIMMTDATSTHRKELLQQGQAAVLNHLYRNDPLEDICSTIVKTIENVETGLICSILRLKKETETLHKLAAPSLPDFYNDAIEGMAIGSDIGSCGAAAFHKKRIVIEDIQEHPNWKRARNLAKKACLRACWSEPIFDHDGKVLGTFAMYYDQPRTPSPEELRIIEAAAELTALAINHKQALVALQQSNALKNELISTAAHELRTPLGSIMGYAELLSISKNTEKLTEKDDKFLDIIIQKAELLSQTIADLFDISKLENGYRLELNKKKVCIVRTVTNVIDYYKRISPSHTFSFETINNVPNSVELDEAKMTQVLDNLLSNAIKYSPDGGLIKIVASAKHNELQLSITDRGVGMSEEHLERIFEKFYRAKDGVPNAKGLGIGMSIVKEIIEAHGGDIKVSSQKGVGTRVQLTVPSN